MLAAAVSAAAAIFGGEAKADEGMWLIQAIDQALEKKMQARGLELSAGEIYNADAEGATIADAVVSLDFGCTGSIISDKGLLITNHHCAYSDVHSLSTDEHNYLEEGFWAMKSDEEVNIPGKNAYFLKKVIDVTNEVEAMLDKASEEGRVLGLRKLTSIMEKKYSRQTGLTAWFSSMWKGSRYYIALYEVYSDVRLVAAPPVSIAAFGGDIDNWEWPQHKCDFAMYRVYTSPDGKPAGFSEANIPMVPKRKLTVSTAGYKPGDFTMILGYPGVTDRYSSSFEVEYDQTIALPISNRVRGEQMAIIRSHMEDSPSIRLKYSDYYFGLSNVQELNVGEVLCYGRFNVAEQKRAEEARLQEWIDADPARKDKWGNLLSVMEKQYSAVRETKRNTVIYRETLIRGNMISRACTKINSLRSEVLKCQGLDDRKLRLHLWQQANQKAVKESGTTGCYDLRHSHGPGPGKGQGKGKGQGNGMGPRNCNCDEIQHEMQQIDNCCRHYRFCGADFNAITISMKRDYEKFSLEVEKDLFIYAVEEFYTNLDSEWLGTYQKALKDEFTESDGKCDFDALTDFLWNNSFFTDGKRFNDFVTSEHTIDEYMEDPLYKFFNDLRITDFNRKAAEIEGKDRIIDLEKEYTHALYQMRMDLGQVQYPDANSTMRITYGTVGALEPFDAVMTSWRTTPEGILEKYKPSSYEFNLDGRQKSLLENKDWGRWGFQNEEGKSGSMYVDFLTDNDITGGNSGSPVLNSKGELIGLAFDGNKESLASNAYYVNGYNKCVCVDIRFVLWTLDKYARMSHIIEEIGL